MLNYWQTVEKQGAGIQQMLLCDKADVVSKHEVPEILSLLPDYSGKDILELGAGIGRFTGEIAKVASSVTSVDYIPSFLDKNRENNHLEQSSVTFINADVTQLSRPENSADLIFSNRMLMYLDDTDILELFKKALAWLRPNGYLFFRETCFREPDDQLLKSADVHYRRPDAYNSMYQSISIPADSEESVYAFETVFSKSVQTFVKLKSNCNEICWLIQKVRLPTAARNGFKTFQEFLDCKQYSRNGILRYERIFGENFVSTGGLETTEEFVELLNLKPGEHVFDVGAGIGGGEFYMAQKYDVFVTGIDLSANMISIALEKAATYNDPRIQFEVGDATKIDYPEGTYDVIYSRDTILHIENKRDLFASFLKWLKPGGRLLISDYCCTPNEWSDSYKHYVEQRGYHVLSVDSYGQLLKDVGFVNVRAEDRTAHFTEMLNKELKRMDSIRTEFVTEFSEADYEELVEGWNNKLQRCAQGDQKWGLFYAEKQAL